MLASEPLTLTLTLPLPLTLTLTRHARELRLGQLDARLASECAPAAAARSGEVTRQTLELDVRGVSLRVGTSTF